jgi:mRNA interferase MazF
MPSRGDVLLVNLDPTSGSEQAGTRPVIVVSRDAINHSAVNNNRTIVMVCVPLTDRKNLRALYPSHVEIKKGTGGLALDSVALCEQIRSIAPGERLVKFLGRIPEADMARLEQAIKITLDLE